MTAYSERTLADLWAAADHDINRPLADVINGPAVRLKFVGFLVPGGNLHERPWDRSDYDLAFNSVILPITMRPLRAWRVGHRAVTVWDLWHLGTESIAKGLEQLKSAVQSANIDVSVLWSPSSKLLRAISPQLPENARSVVVLGEDSETPGLSASVQRRFVECDSSLSQRG